MTTTQTVDLDSLVRDIGLYNVLKGVSDGVNELRALAKAGKEQVDTPAAPAADAGDGKTKPKTDDQDDDPAPSFEDLRAGSPGGNEFVDVTDMVNQFNAREKKLLGVVTRMEARMERMEKAQASQSEALGNILAPLAKAVGETHLAIERRGSTLTAAEQATANAAGLRIPATPAKPAAGGKLSTVKLAKANQNGIVSEFDMSYYRKNGVFPGTQEEADSKHAKVSALAV